MKKNWSYVACSKSSKKCKCPTIIKQDDNYLITDDYGGSATLSSEQLSQYRELVEGVAGLEIQGFIVNDGAVKMLPGEFLDLLKSAEAHEFDN